MAVSSTAILSECAPLLIAAKTHTAAQRLQEALELPDAAFCLQMAEGKTKPHDTEMLNAGFCYMSMEESYIL